MFKFLGGLGIGVFDSCMVGEELSYGCSGIAGGIASTDLGVSDRKKIWKKSFKNWFYVKKKKKGEKKTSIYSLIVILSHFMYSLLFINRRLTHLFYSNR